jgi:hypothetical protein
MGSERERVRKSYLIEASAGAAFRVTGNNQAFNKKPGTFVPSFCRNSLRRSVTAAEPVEAPGQFGRDGRGLAALGKAVWAD